MERYATELLYEEFINEEASAVRVLDLMIKYAHAVNTSDIHLDPSETKIAIRFRIDGIMRNIHELPKSIYNSVFSRLKIISNLRIDEHNLPQDGRFTIQIEQIVSINVRVSIAPTYFGENAVLRLLYSHSSFSLKDIGLSDDQILLLKESIANPFGLILITGPTGSGKTSTLYSLLQILNSGKQSIVTIEEPVEYSIEGVSQMQVNKHAGFGFAEGLRSILRQDPNIIGIGEIRDPETASLAIHAALTGHLVLSTLHSTTATSAIPRMTTMGVESYLLSSTLTLVINQRLLRRLCTNCREKKPLLESHIKRIENLIPSDSENEIYHYYSNGCLQCAGTGSKGRIGIFEFLVVNDSIREEISAKISSSVLFQKAHHQGMKSLLDDGLAKAIQGIVSLEDVLALIHE
jgi:type IV pilus assembly protein PilB